MKTHCLPPVMRILCGFLPRSVYPKLQFFDPEEMLCLLFFFKVDNLNDGDHQKYIYIIIFLN